MTRGKKRQCSNCEATTVALSGLCIACRPVKRPATWCPCGNKTWAVSGCCPKCPIDAMPEDGDSPNVLAEGSWVRRGLTKVWVPNPEASKPRLRGRFVAAPKPPCNTETAYQWHRNNEPDNWPLPTDDPCGCRAAHRAHEAFRAEMRRRTRRAS